jgi:hypothetical protein
VKPKNVSRVPSPCILIQQLQTTTNTRLTTHSWSYKDNPYPAPAKHLRMHAPNIHANYPKSIERKIKALWQVARAVGIRGERASSCKSKLSKHVCRHEIRQSQDDQATVSNMDMEKRIRRHRHSRRDRGSVEPANSLVCCDQASRRPIAATSSFAKCCSTFV